MSIHSLLCNYSSLLDFLDFSLSGALTLPLGVFTLLVGAPLADLSAESAEGSLIPLSPFFKARLDFSLLGAFTLLGALTLLLGSPLADLSEESVEGSLIPLSPFFKARLDFSLLGAFTLFGAFTLPFGSPFTDLSEESPEGSLIPLSSFFKARFRVETVDDR